MPVNVKSADKKTSFLPTQRFIQIDIEAGRGQPVIADAPMPAAEQVRPDLALFLQGKFEAGFGLGSVVRCRILPRVITFRVRRWSRVGGCARCGLRPGGACPKTQADQQQPCLDMAARTTEQAADTAAAADHILFWSIRALHFHRAIQAGSGKWMICEVDGRASVPPNLLGSGPEWVPCVLDIGPHREAVRVGSTARRAGR